MEKVKSDLHLHSVLSPCADLLITPGEIVKIAKEKNIKILALTDHNSAENAEVFEYYCEKNNILFIPAMEVETKEEIHILSYFPDLKTLKKWQDIVYENLPQKENDEDFFGPQIKCDFTDEYEEKITQMLAGAVNLGLEDTIKKIIELGGIAVPSHLDRKNSIISQLGFIPPDLDFKTVEISKNISLENALEKYPQLSNFQIIKNSDSHYLKDIKAYHYLYLKDLNFVEFKKALKMVDGRKVILI
jgi:hypothetical protein